MGLKKQLSMGIITAALGLTLIGGGTYAYFSDTEDTNSTFAAGTLDLSAEPTQIIDIDNMKPGDTMTRDFVLKNNGSLDIKNVSLETDYTVVDVQGDNEEDFGKYIEVEFLYNADQLNEVVYKTTLSELKDMSPEAIEEKVFEEILDQGGLESGNKNDFVVKFNFLDNNKDQNQFQGDKLNLEWTFHAKQADGETLE